MGEILNYPRDILRRKYFVPEHTEHQAKLEVQTYIWLVEKYTSPGDIILDPMSGIGTVHFAATMGRHTVGIEISERFYEIQQWNLAKFDEVVGLTGGSLIYWGDCRRFLPLTGWPASFGNMEPQVQQALAERQQKADIVIFCLDPKSLILTHNFTWQPLEDLKIGDTIVGVDEYPEGEGRSRLLRPTQIEDKTTHTLDTFQITLEDGRELICSGEHKWLGYRYPSSTMLEWFTTSQLRPGMALRSFSRQTWVPDTSFEGGYISGVLDGEGSIKTETGAIGFKQLPGLVWDFVCQYLETLGIEYWSGVYNGVNMLTVTRRDDCAKLLGITQPLRLLPQAQEFWYHHELPNRDFKAYIQSITYTGKKELIGLKTTTNTLIVNGIVSHNSPPYGDLWKTTKKSAFHEEKHINIGYSDDAGNIGNITNYPLYLAAMREVYSLCNRSLKPGGRLITVTKDYVRARQRVYISKDNVACCLDAGFQVEDWHFRYTDPKVFQIGARKERAEAGINLPELDIDYEDVIVLQKVREV